MPPHTPNTPPNQGQTHLNLTPASLHDIHPPQRTPLTTPDTPITLDHPTPLTLLDTELILTSGHGAFALHTALLTPRRRYHALLNAAATPPVGRVATLDLAESVSTTNHTTPLQPTESRTPLPTPDASPADAAPTLTTDPNLRSTRVAASAAEITWHLTVTHDARTTTLVKTLRIARDKNSAAVRYRITTDAPASANPTLTISPLLLLRDYHALHPSTTTADFDIQHTPSSLTASRTSTRNQSTDTDAHTLHLTWTLGTYTHNPRTAPTRSLFIERDRGATPDEHGNHTDADTPVIPGDITVPLSNTQPTTLEVRFSLAPDTPDDTLFDGPGPCAEHLDTLASNAEHARPHLKNVRALVHASDAYLVSRTVDSTPLKTVLAGYPWFADWGRDTMIALPGLMLITNRHDDALATLRTFARYVSRGMIPNRFDDYSSAPEYNTVDASLWFLHAAALYLEHTDNTDAYNQHLLPACKDIIHGYANGTRYNIHADKHDHLIVSGTPDTQLTWMDAKREGVVFTPRHGKAVEINALWHRGLRATARAVQDTDATLAAELNERAEHTAHSFRNLFPGHPAGGLHDCFHPDDTGQYHPVPHIRFNQVFAVSLPDSPLDQQTQQDVVNTAASYLYTPLGMRTCAPPLAHHDSPRYRPHFTGDMMSRDDAYHNGTAWPWLTGPYAEAILRAHNFSDESKAHARAALQPLLDTLAQGCLGQIAEVADAEPRWHGHAKHQQREGGCPAQAWSVAEPLRIADLIDR